MTQLRTDEAKDVIERIDELIERADAAGATGPAWAQLLKVLRDARKLLAPAPPTPEMRIVTGFPHDDETRTDGDPDEHDGQVQEGLQCPYPDCGVIVWEGYDYDYDRGVRVIDVGERRNTFGYGRGWVEEHEIRVVDGRRMWVGSGRKIEHRKIYGDYGDSADMHTDRYECASCDRPVRLPPDVDEEGM